MNDRRGNHALRSFVYERGIQSVVRPAAIPADVERFGIPLFPLPQGEDQGEGLYGVVRNAILTVEPAFII